jgi:hypothetical protein
VTVRTCGFHDHDNPDNAGLKDRSRSAELELQVAGDGRATNHGNIANGRHGCQVARTPSLGERAGVGGVSRAPTTLPPKSCAEAARGKRARLARSAASVRVS